MPATDRDIARAAFGTPEWVAASDALFQATGVTMTVMDLRTAEVISTGGRCGCCHLATDVESPGPLTCFDACPDADALTQRVICRAGLPTLIAAVKLSGRVVAHVVAGGFVTSTRERRRIFEHMLARGVREDSARIAVKAIPVVSRRQAEAYLQIALSTATTLLNATAERLSAADRAEELRVFMSAGQQVASVERLDPSALSSIAEEAVALVGGEAGAVLRRNAAALEVLARTDRWRGPLGAIVPIESTAAGRALTTGRTVLAAASKDAFGNVTLALPLMIGTRVLGVLEVRLPAESVPPASERLARLDRFGRFIAIALEREDERIQVERAMAGYAQLNALAAALGGQTDLKGVAQLMTSVLDKSFTFDIAGLVLTSWGRDHADVVISGDVNPADLDSVLSEVAGRDVAADPFESVRTVTYRGQLVDDAARPEEFATLAVELQHEEHVIGYLFVARGDGGHYSAQDHALLEGFAAHGGAAFGRAALFGRIRDDYAKTIAALSATLDAGERMPTGHASRVMEYAMLIGEELGLPFEDVEALRFAGLLHDIGKTGVPEEILLKPSKLSAEEFARVRSHAEFGASIVDQIEFLKGLTPIILHHHERWDGKGYPAGLEGQSIPLLARVLAVADSYDAMTSARPFSTPLSVGDARSELEAGAGTQYDPRIVAALLEVLDRMVRAGGTGLIVAPDLLPGDQLLA